MWLNMIPIFFHEELFNRKDDSARFSYIPKNGKRFPSITYEWLRKLDFMNFMKMSLVTNEKVLTGGEKSPQKNFFHTKNTSGDQCEMTFQKTKLSL